MTPEGAVNKLKVGMEVEFIDLNKNHLLCCYLNWKKLAIPNIKKFQILEEDPSGDGRWKTNLHSVSDVGHLFVHNDCIRPYYSLKDLVKDCK